MAEAQGKNSAAAASAWGAALPDWIAVLADACDGTNQVRVAEMLGLSPATVNSLLRNRYGAKPDRIEALVRGRLMEAVVDCPVLGQLATDLCQEWQQKARTFADTSSLRRRMRRACLECPLCRASGDRT